MKDFLLIWSLLIILFGILGVVVAIAGSRRLKAKRLIVFRDYRNPNRPRERYWAIYDKQIDGIKLYSNLLKPFKSELSPPFNMKAYEHDGAIWCIRGVTGNPDFNGLIPVHHTLVGKIGSGEMATEVAGAIRNTQEFINLCSKFKIGQVVEYTQKEKRGGFIGIGQSEAETHIQGSIVDIGYGGVSIQYERPVAKKVWRLGKEEVEATTELALCVVGEPSRIPDITSRIGEEDWKNLAVTPLEKFYNAEWVMHNFGAVPVDDVNAILESQKSAVAQFNSKLDERRKSRESWLARHTQEMLIIVFFAIVVIMLIIFWQAVTSDIATIVAQAKGQAVSQSSVTNSIIGSILPKTPTGPS